MNIKKITILGHCNISLGIILDSLYSVYQSAIEISIISNLEKNQNRYIDVPFLHQSIKTVELHADEWQPNNDEHYVLSGMSPAIKKTIFEYFDSRYAIKHANFISVIHASAVITNGVEISGFVNISPLSVVAQYAKIGNFVSINRNSSVGHHTQIDEFTSINPGCNIGGGCKIGKNVVIGIGATVFDEITIGDNAIIGGGAVVTKDVKANTLVFGSPAKFIRTV
jgi:sugar O-acyltransferase (sialic acid O-acetyltransferase NeuD family)